MQKIAEALFVSEGTVKKHISNIFGKLDMYSRTEVLVFVERNIEKFELALNSVDSIIIYKYRDRIEGVCAGKKCFQKNRMYF